jgi:L-lactate dehydrogenase complex protein LldF
MRSVSEARPIDANTRRFLAAVGTSLPVLADPTPGRRATPDPDALRLRTLAGHIRQHTLDHLDEYLTAATTAIEHGGGHVHWAADAADARRIVADLLGTSPGTVVPSAVLDEVGLTAAPAGGAAALAGPTFVVAETGQVCLAGEGAEVSRAAGATTLVCVAGIEAVVPRPADLAVMLKLTAQAATGRPMAAYTAVFGPTPTRAVHLVWLDNGRSELLAGEHRAVLRCVGCGACTAVCPVYRSAGVRPAGMWAGPVGAIVRAAVRGETALPHASTLCGACADVCPVRIDLPSHLIALRRASPVLARRLRLWAWVVRSPWRYRWAAQWARRRRGMWPAAPPQTFHQVWRQRP